DDDAAVAGGEAPRGLGCGVIGGEAGIGERGDIRWFQCFIDLHDAAGRCLQVLGIPAVGVDAGKRTGLAMHVVTGAAGPAQPAWCSSVLFLSDRVQCVTVSADSGMKAAVSAWSASG